MSKLRKVLTNWRVILLLVFTFFAVIAIHPNPNVTGVTIRSVDVNSSAALAGIESPAPTVRPMARERIISINNRPIENVEDYYDIVGDLYPNVSVSVVTNKGYYKIVTKEEYRTITLNTTETVFETVTDPETNESITIRKVVPQTKTISHGTEDIGMDVYDAPKTNIKKGLDLQGGTRVLLKPAEEVSKNYISDLISSMEQRLNVYGLTDIVLREASDLSGNQYIMIEIAGANEEEVKELLAKQGKFEAKIGNETVFVGGKDITYVCRSADCSGIDPMRGCSRIEQGYMCRFRFAISLTPESAEKQAELTRNLDVITEGSQEYLSKKLYLYLDDALVDELNIGADLRGRAVTDIEISGSGAGTTQQEAMFDALKNMKRLQTILITGNLPVKLEIAKTDLISPLLGEEFLKNAILVGLIAIAAVTLIIFLVYRKFSIALPMALNGVVEVTILLGVASLIGWNLDLAAIAGIIIAVGTGVDHLIVITDETIRGEHAHAYDWKRKIKNAFFIIMAAYFTTVVAMGPLLFAGAGLLKGFALTTIIGVSVGVFISRPAYAAVIEILLRD